MARSGDEAEATLLVMPGVRFGQEFRGKRRRHEANLKNGYLQIAPGVRATSLADKARALGLKPLERVWVKFSRGAASAPTPPTGLEIAEARPADAMEFACAVVAGFAIAYERTNWTL